MTSITLKDKSILKISKIKDNEINLRVCYSQNNKIYEEKYDLRESEDLFKYKTINMDDFIKISTDNKPEIEMSKNDKEIKLSYKINGIKNSIILKELKELKEGPPQGNSDNVDNIDTNAPPSVIFNFTEEINKLKNLYDEKINKIKEENEKLIEENNKLKEEIDEEKRKNDEIVRVYLENREKYEEAVKRNSEIRDLDDKL